MERFLLIMEIWKDIPGFGGRYQVSTEGRVKVKSYRRWNGFGFYSTKEKIIKQFSCYLGYKQVTLMYNWEKVKKKVHRLVAEAFIPNPENKPEIDHINTIVDDNRVKNLRWVTTKENHNNPLTRKHISIAKKGKGKKVRCIDKNGRIYKFNTLREGANFFNIDSAHISGCCKGQRKTAGGCKWEYDL